LKRWRRKKARKNLRRTINCCFHTNLSTRL
jgi:hypothetical protein